MRSGLKSKNVLTRYGLRPATIIIEEKKITRIEDYSYDTDFDVTDYRSLAIMPGIVDTHVHINDPGRDHWEGFETATRSAAAGGVTTIVDMPLNSIPATVNSAALNEKIKAAEGKLYVDCGFYGGIIPGNEEDLPALIADGVLGFKAFMIDSGVKEFPFVTEEDLKSALKKISDYTGSVPLLVHAEKEGETNNIISHDKSFKSFLKARPEKWETDAIRVLINLSREFDFHIHIVHVSSSDSIDIIRDAKNKGLRITAETCPHYLFFSAEEIADGDTRFKCTPPIRYAVNKEKLWNAVREGVIDFIVSDHSPCPAEMKCLDEGNFQKAWGGISSIQHSLSAVWTEAHKRGFSLQKVSELMSMNTSDFIGFGNRKGKIAEGYDADLLVFDPDKSFNADEQKLFCKNKLTPYHERKLLGTVEATYLRGEKIYSDGFFPAPKGKVFYNTAITVS